MSIFLLRRSKVLRGVLRSPTSVHKSMKVGQSLRMGAKTKAKEDNSVVEETKEGKTWSNVKRGEKSQPVVTSTRAPKASSTSAASKVGNYEEKIFNIFKRYKISAAKTGGTVEDGLNFKGTWELPSKTLDITGQLKNEKKATGSKYMRDTIGTFGKEKQGTLAIYITNQGWSEQSERQAMKATVPLLLWNVAGVTDAVDSVLVNTTFTKDFPNLSVAHVFFLEDPKKEPHLVFVHKEDNEEILIGGPEKFASA
eukprot:TRINITY_DN394_c0_g1_i1.p1 TRINITY_DN394_c0_g1~~TRINITY_DN394_c0_g1_i1.p1  ORF type:complete len:253 (+),score=53.12 TRINITY_DN394_c0_g1_i1:145-903(+)